MVKYLLIIFSVTFLKFAIFIASDQQPSYIPTENITLNCGAQSESYGSDDGRFWAGDKSSSFGPIESSHNNKSQAYEAVDSQGGYVAKVPFMNARVSTSELKYAFPVTPGQKFLRLYFHSASYNNFEPENAFFSVKTGSFTILNNFSALLVAKSSGVGSFFREYILYVDETEVLDLVFTPSPSPSNDTYAFINGIEIVSMPPNLYHSPPDLEGVRYIGQSTSFYVNNYTALENVYRFNVGGKPISPMCDDTAMFRLWSDDSDYMTTNSYLSVNTTVPINYKITSRYTAPEGVYRTARTMGPNRAYNEKHNLTWRLPVDSEFKYMVRLHFCEFQDPIDSPGERQFSIFLNGQTAEEVADVIIWAVGDKVPIYKDYVVMVSNIEIGKKNKQSKITIDLHPREATYFDVILNGIEVFKLNNSDGNLAGLNPELQVAHEPSISASAGGKSKMKPTTLMLIVGIGCGVGLLALFSLLVWRHNKKREIYGGASTKLSMLPGELCRRFALDEIKAATNNFDDDLVIGTGGFGNVYKGFLDDGDKTVVAIKRLNLESRQGFAEFFTEMEMLSKLRHIHLVSLIGYCNENSEMILVYDYMSNGTLSDHLYGDIGNVPLTWKQRLEICKGAAMALDYLHTGVKHTVIHRDVKSNNILLDDRFTAKVSDFGLSKTDPKIDKLNTAVKGTWGYLDPEYARGHELTEKSDVYSFGVVLFEALCARKAFDRKLPEGQVNLAHWARKCTEDGTIYQVIDPYLIGKIAPESFKVFVETAENCTVELGVNRPSMNDVMEKLGFSIELQEAADLEKKKLNRGGDEHSYPDVVFPVARDIDFDDGSTVDSTLDSDTYSGIRNLDSNTTGMTYPFIGSSKSWEFLSSTSNTTKSTGN